MEHADRVFYRGFSGNALYCLYNDFLSLSIGVKLSLVHNLVDVACCICTGFVFQTLNKTVLCLFCAETGKFLKLCTLLKLHLIEFLLLNLQKFLFIINTLLLLIYVLLSAAQFFLALIQRELSLLQAVLALLNFLVTALHLLFEFRLFIKKNLLNLELLLFLQHFSFFLSCRNHFIIFPGKNIPEYKISA